MKPSDAKKILSGELKPFGVENIILSGKYGGDYHNIQINKSEMQFALRQLALKVEREHKKMNEREK